MADGHACLGELLLFVGESEEARKNLEIALRGFKDYSGPENVLLDKANVLHFLGEAYCNRYDQSSRSSYIFRYKRVLTGYILTITLQEAPLLSGCLRNDPSDSLTLQTYHKRTLNHRPREIQTPVTSPKRTIFPVMSRNAHNGENGDSGKTSSEVLLGKVDKLTKMANLEKN